VATDPEEEAAEVFDEQARRRSRVLRGYKIQEVIKRRQILLVQVVKEERGNKGAALTTYLSLAGRYSVLMPNTARGGGISRKIANPADRSRLKAIARELEVPEGMGLIIRTAGQERNKLEIRRDYEYSLRLWNDIRERTLQSIAPCTIHEEGALVKRAIRDLYARDIDEVLVEGDEGFRAARKIMGMLTPSRTRRVKLYKEDVPLFHHYGVEERLDALHNPVIDLASGGSIVIHATEALTAIDVNSGRSTRERNIEETALKTNVEAAEEVSRQLRLRDIAGLVVIDFIDMADPRNQRVVERRLRDQLKVDRARVQLGRISPFGLLELSRQRLRPSFQELSANPCPTCHGSGAIRSVESAALQAMRAIELAGMKGGAAALAIGLPIPVALYVLNQKRGRLIGLEQRYQITVDFQVDPALVAGEYRLETTEPRVVGDEVPERAPERAAAPAEAAAAEVQEDDADAGGRRRRRRRRRRKKAGDGEMEAPEATAPEVALPALSDSLPPMVPADGAEAPATATTAAADLEPPAAAAETPRRRVRTRRRRSAAGAVDGAEASPSDAPAAAVAGANGGVPEASNGAGGLDQLPAEVPALSEAPGFAEQPGVGPDESADQDLEQTPEASAPDPRPAEPRAPRRARGARRSATASGREVASKRSERRRPAPDEPTEVVDVASEDAVPAAAVVDRGASEPPRRGWWSRFVRKDE
jgi:ribonuclease E